MTKQTPEHAAYMKAYREAHREEKKAYNKAYRQVPKNKAREKEKQRTPEYQARQKAYGQRPEVKARAKARCQTPEHKAYEKTRQQSVHRKAYRQSERWKNYMKAFRGSPEEQARIRERQRSPEWKAYLNVYHHSARGRAAARAAESRRSARELSLASTFTASDWEYAVDYFHGCCAVCGRPPGLWHKLSADHWIPLTSPDCPGTVPWNIVPLCHGIDGCNNSKHNRSGAEWLAENFTQRKARKTLVCIETFLTSREAQQ